VEFDEGRKTQPQAFAISLGERRPQELIEEKTGLEVRPRRRVLDPVHTLPEVQPLAIVRGNRKQPLQPAPQVGGLADVGFSLPVSTQKKHRWLRRNRGEELLIVAGIELEPVGKHSAIVVGDRFLWHGLALRPSVSGAAGRRQAQAPLLDGRFTSEN